MKKFLALFLLPAMTTPAFAAQSAFLIVEGSKTGAIKGEAPAAKHEGKIVVVAADHLASNSQPVTIGRAAVGKRDFGPFNVTVKYDRSGPLLLNAFQTGEIFKTVRAEFWNTAPEGMATNTLTIELKNARLVSAAFNSTSPGEEQLTLSFSFQSMTHTAGKAGVSAELAPATP